MFIWTLHLFTFKSLIRRWYYNIIFRQLPKSLSNSLWCHFNDLIYSNFFRIFQLYKLCKKLNKYGLFNSAAGVVFWILLRGNICLQQNDSHILKAKNIFVLLFYNIVLGTTQLILEKLYRVFVYFSDSSFIS